MLLLKTVDVSCGRKERLHEKGPVFGELCGLLNSARYFVIRNPPFGRNRPILRGLAGPIGKSAIIYPVSTLNSIALVAVNLGLVFYLRDSFDAAPALVGLVSALYSIAYFIGCFVFRPLGRHLLPRHSLLISIAANLLFVSGMLASRTLVSIAICNALYGFGVSFFWPPIMGWLSTGLEGRALGGALSRFNLSWGIGLVISPWLTGILAEIDSRYPIFAGLVLFLLIGVIVLVGSFALRAIRDDRRLEPPPPERGVPTRDASSTLRFPSWVGIVGSYVLMGVFGVVFPIHARTNLLLTESAIGGVLLFRAVATTLAFVVLGRSSFWHNRSALIVAVQLALALGSLVLSLFDGVVIYLVVLPFLGVLIAVAYSQSVFHGAVGAAARARRMAIHEALLVAGSVIGSLGGSYVFQQTSASTLFVAVAALLVVAALVQTILIMVPRVRSRAI
jgi:MFS family permease